MEPYLQILVSCIFRVHKDLLKIAIPLLFDAFSISVLKMGDLKLSTIFGN